MTTRDGQATRQRIVAQAARLLNASGYLRTPVSEIMRATGMQKGGIYNHFESRDALALEAFEYAVGLRREQLRRAMEGKVGARAKLVALLGAFREPPADNVMKGGCPIANLSVESDDADLALRNAARRAMAGLIGMFERVIAEGMREGEFAKGDARRKASQMVAALEGGLLLSNLYKDDGYLRNVADELEKQLEAGLR
ncbi:MAG: TetR/AcrR family transcriptional regulator [Burkholderiales bacterium]